MLIFDPIRKKHVTLTPEEGVRQNLINYLVKEKGYPLPLISVEFPLKYARLNKRSDLLVSDNNGRPVLLIECKAPDVSITNKVFEQISIYNQSIKAPYLLVTNGINNYFMKSPTENSPLIFFSEIPDYSALIICE